MKFDDEGVLACWQNGGAAAGDPKPIGFDIPDEEKPLEEEAAAEAADVDENREPDEAPRDKPNAGCALPEALVDARNENPVGDEEEDPLLKMEAVTGWELEPNKSGIPDGAKEVLLLELKELRPVENDDEELSPKAEPEIAEDMGKLLLRNDLVEAPKEKILGIVDVDTPEEAALSSDPYKLPTCWVLSLWSDVIASGGVTGEVLEAPDYWQTRKENQECHFKVNFLHKCKQILQTTYFLVPPFAFP